MEQAYYDLQEAEARAQLNARASDISWKLVVSQEQRDTVGGGDAKELLRSLERWYNWRFKYFEAVGAQNQALARLSRAVGTDLTAAGNPRARGRARP